MASLRAVIVGGAIAVVVAGGLIYLQTSGTPPAEIADLLADGGERLLRPEMRPARGAPRVLLFALDGVGDEELRRALRDGEMPHLAALTSTSTGEGVWEHAYAAENVLSILPSITLAAWSSLFTGEPPGRTGIPGNEWFVREENRYYAPSPVSITDNADALKVYSDDLLGGVLRVPTIYETANVRSFVSLSQIHRGADLLTIPAPAALGDVVAAVASGVSEDDPVEQELFRELDDTSVESLVESLRAYGVPDLQVVYLPGVDLFTHIAPDPEAMQREYLSQVIDDAAGRVLDEYRRQGALDGTYVMFVADHGHTSVLGDDRHALGAEGEDEPPAVLTAAGFRVRPPALEVDSDADFQAVLAFQGAFAFVYLADRSTCAQPGQPCDWRRPPRLEQDVLPAVRAFDAASRTGAGVPQMQGTLDLIFAREPVPTGIDALPFQVWNGETLVPIADYLAANPRPDLIDLENRLEMLATGPYGHRAGDVLLLTRFAADGAIEDRFYFSGEYTSWHGSPTAQDSRIPLLVARSDMSGDALRGLMAEAIGDAPSQLDIAPLVQFLLRAP